MVTEKDIIVAMMVDTHFHHSMDTTILANESKLCVIATASQAIVPMTFVTDRTAFWQLISPKPQSSNDVAQTLIHWDGNQYAHVNFELLNV